MNYELMAPCHFGLETVLKREIYDLGYEIKKVEDGHVYYEADEDGIVISNLCLRTAERLLLVVGRFTAKTYEDFFQGMKDIQWDKYLPENAKFWVTKATSVKSKLFSTTDLQRVGKRAMVARMQGVYHLDHFPETGSDYPVRIFIYKDEVTVTLDTSGDALHKRGYRKETGKAPISETIAAALIMLTPWRADRILADPFCGSGTIPIEAALIAANIAPGLYRNFAAEGWDIIDKKLWSEEKKWLREAADTNVETQIYGSDIDPEMIRVANENAARAGVKKLIHFKRADAADFRSRDSYGFMITNPPYGERLAEKEELPELYTKLKNAYRGLDKWSLYVITAWEDATKYLGGKPDKNRKIYNGMLKTYFNQYMGPKPPKVKRDGKD